MSDNWLQEELKRESKLSVWDFDDRASYLDDEHKKHCEAKEIREIHKQEHEGPIPQRVNVKGIPVSDIDSKKVAGITIAISMFTIMFILFCFIVNDLGDIAFAFIEAIFVLMIIYYIFRGNANRREK